MHPTASPERGREKRLPLPRVKSCSTRKPARRSKLPAQTDSTRQAKIAQDYRLYFHQGRETECAQIPWSKGTRTAHEMPTINWESDRITSWCLAQIRSELQNFVVSDVLQLLGDLDPVEIQDLRSPWQSQETARLGSANTTRVHNWTQHLTSVPIDDTLLRDFQAK